MPFQFNMDQKCSMDDKQKKDWSASLCSVWDSQIWDNKLSPGCTLTIWTVDGVGKDVSDLKVKEKYAEYGL